MATKNENLRGLYATLQRRKRPEDVAHMIVEAIGASFDRNQRAILQQAARGSVKAKLFAWTSMMEDFARPQGMERQVRVAEALFEIPNTLTAEQCADPGVLEAFLRTLNAEICKAYGRADFKWDRLNRQARELAGIGELSRRRYNKLFRLLGRMEAKLRTLARELKKLEFTQVGKSGLATRLGWDDFAANESSAAFIAYFVARSNLRSEFTGWGQKKPFDEIAQMLFERCLADRGTNWWAIAHVFANRQVFDRLDDRQKGALLGAWFEVLGDVAVLLEEVWNRSNIDRTTMIVRRGNDSTTWNNTANAWNTARKHWIGLLWSMGLPSMLDVMCPGKVLRLMAADVAAWHRSLGKGLDPDTAVWNEIPLPWLVTTGRLECTRSTVAAACARHGLDPVQRGWLEPAPLVVEAYSPTPELVHGVAVSSPALASALRRAGWFSGKPGGGPVGGVTVERDAHGYALGARPTRDR